MLSNPIEFSFILATIGVIFVLIAIGVFIVKKGVK